MHNGSFRKIEKKNVPICIKQRLPALCATDSGKSFDRYGLRKTLFTLKAGEKSQILTSFRLFLIEQGRIHGRTVADGWAGAVMQKPLEI